MATMKSNGNTYVVFDTETTGLDVIRDGIVEIGAIRITNGKVVDKLVCLVQTSAEMSPKAFEVHQITDAEIEKTGKKTKTAFKELLDFVGTDPLIAHNGLGFDYPMLFNHLKRFGLSVPANPILDTLVLVRRFLGVPRGSGTLEQLRARYKIETGKAHRAEADALAAAKLYALVCAKEPSLEKLWAECGSQTLDKYAELPDGYELLSVALEQGAFLELSYAGIGKPERERWIQPLRFCADRGGNLSVSAFCPEAGIEKSFRVDRMKKLLQVANKPKAA